MKRLCLGLLLVFSFLLVSCVGGVAKKPVPRHLTVGQKETEKGLQWYKKGCYHKSLYHFFRAYELFSMSDLLDGVAMSLNNLGTIHRTLRNHEEAIAAFQEAYRIYSEIDDQEGAVKALSSKAATLIQMGDLDKSAHTLDRAFSEYSKISEKGLLISLLQNKGVLLTKRGQYEEAYEVLKTCLKQSKSIPAGERASLHFAFGNVLLQTNRPSEAVTSFQRALSLDKEIGFFRGIADDLSFLAQAYLLLGQEEKAVRTLERSVKILALLDLPDEVNKTMEVLQKSAQETHLDISVTEGFVERWRQGRLYESPCGG
jgi:tetratricopeptide (TPR) repeat protein